MCTQVKFIFWNKHPHILAYLFILCNAHAQDLKLDLISLTEEQKENLAVRNITGNLLAGIAYAKAMGMTPEDFGKFYGNRFSFAWTNINVKRPKAYVQNLYRLLQTERDFQFEIISEVARGGRIFIVELPEKLGISAIRF
jgi:hypothetical protein